MHTALKAVPWRWVAFWIILPNLAIIAMWPVGGPTMSLEILLAGMFAVNLKFAKRAWVRYAGMLAIFVYIWLKYTTKSFNMPLMHLSGMHQYLLELNLTQSPEYLIGGAVILASLIASLAVGPRLDWPEKPQAIYASCAVLAMIAGGDYWFTAGSRGSYKAEAPEGTPFDSAMHQVGLTPATIDAPNLVVVIVESWGVPNNDFDRAINQRIWDPAKWESRYEYTSGQTAYFGSTTNAEIRELCGEWNDHIGFDYDSMADKCLPRQFAAEGFHTVALHSFNGEFFHRQVWYPRIGFEENHFDADLIANGASFCDGVFGGACDRDVPAQITQILKNSQNDRNLVYWLTVNAHLPVATSDQLGTDSCDIGSAEWREDFPMLCRSYAIHAQVADALTAEIMAEDFPTSDILIVGDHMPPFFPRAIRSRFDADHVPWIFLKARENAGAGSEFSRRSSLIASLPPIDRKAGNSDEGV